MRKVKGWIAYMVVCVLILTCAPIPASAASGAGELGGVTIKLNEKIEGVNARNYEKYLDVDFGNFQLFDKMEGDGYYVEDSVNYELGDMTGDFEAGKNYSVFLYLIPQEGYVMVEGDVINYTYNGETKTETAQSITIDGVKYIYINICCQMQVSASTVVDSVSMTIEMDLDGVSTADYNSYATLNSESLEYCFDGIYVTDTAYNEMDVFEAGKTYELWISLEAKAGFKLPAVGKTVSCKINGTDVTATVCAETTGGIKSYYLDIVYQMLVPTVINQVSFEYSGYEYGKEIEEVSATSMNQVDVMYTFVADKDGTILTSGTLEADTEYLLMVYFKAQTEYILKLSKDDVKLVGKSADIYEYADGMALGVWKLDQLIAPPPHEHTYTVYCFDEEKHWKECNDLTCPDKENSKKDIAIHAYDTGSVTKSATETETGVKTYTCLVCNYKKEEIIPVTEKREEAKEEQNIATVQKKGATIEDTATGNTYIVTKPDAKKAEVAFSKPKNKKIKSVTIPDTVTIDGVTYKVTSIQKNAFSGCTKLTKVTIGKNVITIDDKAFYKCTKLSKITIPAKVSKIGKQAFYGCKKLKSITIKTKKLTSKKVGSKAFTGTPKNAKVKVPSKSLKSYKKFLYKKGLNKKAKIKK